MAKESIGKTLGAYAAKFHKIKRIEEAEIEAQEFHSNWKARLSYNLKELNNNDSLLKTCKKSEVRLKS